ncbi:MAG TPA: enoyl-CoA hydratase/isomerase family protein [Parafilimonas sp.]|nr:enoyl-CoA hydratase/isomerase family protein [Parafilimonas sp.]
MTQEIQQGYVKTETHQDIMTIEFYHPQSNSLPAKILEKLTEKIHFAAHNDDCKMIVLRSAGDGAFCGGASFDELFTITTEMEAIKFFSGFASVINAMRKCPKFIVGRVQGKCVGGGVGLIAACDYAIAMEGADVKLSELSLGIGPFVVGPAVERKIGVAAFSQLAIDAASWHSADWARRKGLYTELHHSAEGMEEGIEQLSISLVHMSPHAVAELKKILWHDTDHWDKLLYERAVISGKLALSSYTKNFIQQFKEKQFAKNKQPS